MLMKIKKLLYWCSVFLPAIDIVKGAVAGFRQLWNEAREERTQREIDLRIKEMKERFLNDD